VYERERQRKTEKHRNIRKWKNERKDQLRERVKREKKER